MIKTKKKPPYDKDGKTTFNTRNNDKEVVKKFEELPEAPF